MFGISGLELLIIVLFVLIVFGPDKLPELSRTFGKTMRMFKRAQEDMERVIRAEVYDPNADNEDVASAARANAEAEAEAAPTTKAATIWASTEEDDEEEDEE